MLHVMAFFLNRYKKLKINYSVNNYGKANNIMGLIIGITLLNARCITVNGYLILEALG